MTRFFKIPKKTKYKKYHLQKVSTYILNKRQLYHSLILKSNTRAYLTLKQIEAFRRILSKNLKRKGCYHLRFLPLVSFTKKPEGVRMGKGKGKFSDWKALIYKGSIISEINSLKIDNSILYEILFKAKKKLPIPTKLYNKVKTSEYLE